MIRQELKNHKKEYFALIVGLASFVLLFLYFWPNVLGQLTTAIGLGVYYFIWGIATHRKQGKVEKKVVFEYLGMAVLASMLLILLLV
jgi:hypothetical protein